MYRTGTVLGKLFAPIAKNDYHTQIKRTMNPVSATNYTLNSLYKNQDNNSLSKWYDKYSSDEVKKRIYTRNKTTKDLINMNIDAQNNNLCEKEKHSNLLFATPKVNTLVDWKNIKAISNKIPDELEYRNELCNLDSKHKGESIYSAIDEIIKYDKFDRLGKGSMKMSTISTEYKRKQIIAGLLGIGDVTTSREKIQDKLDIYLALYYSKIFEDNVKNAAINTSSDRLHFRENDLKSIKLDAQKKIDINERKMKTHTMKNKPFYPKLEFYESMKQRFKSIKPQIKKLYSDERILAPISSEEFVRMRDKTIIRGTINDAEYFEKKRGQVYRK